MGYTTYFVGKLDIEPPLTEEQSAKIKAFNEEGYQAVGPKGYCQWTLNWEGQLVWDSGEKFYDYIDWLQYLLDAFFTPWGRTLGGSVMWQGEEVGDVGMITCVPAGNKTTVVTSKELRKLD